MSLYQFAPMPSFGIGEEPFATWEGGFSDEDIKNIDKLIESRKVEQAFTGNSETDPKVRVSEVSWIELADDSAWLYDKLAYIANRLNGQFYRFDLYGFGEHMQYTFYKGGDNGHYTWHVDSGVLTDTPRKLSVVLQLSDPSEYEGGDLEILNGPEITGIKKQKGLVTVFPSYVLHRVTPVTSGVRKTLVVWVTGPAFR